MNEASLVSTYYALSNVLKKLIFHFLSGEILVQLPSWLRIRMGPLILDAELIRPGLKSCRASEARYGIQRSQRRICGHFFLASLPGGDQLASVKRLA